MKRDFLTIRDLSREEILSLLRRGTEIKQAGGRPATRFEGRVLGLLFNKASTRTRVSFEVAMFRLGGQTVFLREEETQVSRDEPVKDTARVLSRYLDALAVRTFSQGILAEMARWAAIPVINALTDEYHPCQVLSDLMTVQEKLGDLRPLRVAWIGDGNNVANSWINAAAVLGFELTLACPPGYRPLAAVLEAAGPGVRVVGDPLEAARGADVLNTDVWASMGQEAERKERIEAFDGFQLNADLVAAARPGVLVMHCLPAHRGEEISEAVLEGPRSVVFDQAENKMHLQQALLELLLEQSGR